ncbi:MAG: PLP-dependent aminotransferase family protein [Gemmatimonadota bacterium]
MTTLVQLSGSGSLHRQIYESLRTGILSGRLKPDIRLPASRELASELGVSRNVVLLAYEVLVGEGYAEGRMGSGTYVASSLPESMLTASRSGPRVRPELQAAAEPRLSAFARRLDIKKGSPPDLGPAAPELRYDFRYGFADVKTLPLQALRRLAGKRLRAPSLNNGPAEGMWELRQAVADYLSRARAIDCDPDQIIIVAGSQQGLDFVARVLLDPGDRIAIEEPCYLGAREVFEAAGAELISMPVDDEGLVVSKLPPPSASLKLVYVTPSHQFPTGGILSLGRRLELLDWGEQTGAYILEDDYDGEYRYEARPLEALQGLDRGGRVIYLGTFSKVLFPALRLGYLVLPDPLLPYFRAAKWIADRCTPPLLQEAMADFITSGQFESHLRRSRLTFASRRKALLSALDRELGDKVEVQGAKAGVHVVVWLPQLPVRRVPELLERAARLRVGVESVAHCYASEPDRAGLLFGYQSLTEDEIDTAVCLLARALDEMEGGGSARGAPL